MPRSSGSGLSQLLNYLFASEIVPMLFVDELCLALKLISSTTPMWIFSLINKTIGTA